MAFDVEQYIKDRRNKQKSATPGTTGGSFDVESYIKQRNVPKVQQSITDRVNTWLKNNNDFVSNYNSRISGRKDGSYVSDSEGWLSGITEQKGRFDAERDSILSVLSQYEGFLDPEWAASVSKVLKSAGDQQDSILSYSTADRDFWKQFDPNEEQVAAGMTAQGLYGQWYKENGYRKKYEGQTYDDVLRALDTLEDGEEKDWLTSYRASMYNDEMLNYDTADAEIRLQSMERILASYDHAADCYNRYQNNPEAFRGSEYEDFRTMARAYLQYQQKFGSKQDLEKLIHDTKLNVNNAKRIQEGHALAGVTGDADFANKSGYVSTESDDWYRGVTTKFGMGYDDLTYEYINGKDNGMRSEIYGKAVARDAKTDAYDLYDRMTDEQIAIYNYHYATGGKETAEKYLDSIIESLSYQEASDRFSKMKDKTALELFFSIEAGVDQFQSGVKNLFSGDDYIPTSATQYTSGMVREDLADAGPKLPGWMGGASIGQGVYDLGVVGANMAPSILASSAVSILNPVAGAIVGNTLMGASAAGNAYRDVINRGYGKQEAMVYAGAIGVSEALLGYALGGISKLGGVSSKLTKAVAGIDNGLLRFALQYGGKIGAEGLEEGMQEILDPILQNAILRADEDIDWGEVAYSALLGGLSAGVFELTGTISETRAETALNKQAKEQYGDGTGDLIQQGLESDVNSDSYKLAQKYQKQTESGKAMNGAQIRNLLAANQEQITPKDLQKIQKAAEERLTALGQTEDVSKVAELATKFATGQKLSRSEKSLLANSAYGARVANELLPSNIMSGDYSTEWAENIGTRNVNATAYNKKAIRSILDAMANAEDPATYKPMTDRVGEESRYSVSENGQTTLRESDEAVSIAEVAKVEDGRMTVKLTDGREVYAGDIDFADDSESYLYSAIADMENITPAAATALVKGYDASSGQTVQEYVNGIDEAYTYGYHGYSEADMAAGQFTTKLSNEQSMSAYKLGQSAKTIGIENASNAIKRMRTAVEVATEKSAATVSEKESVAQGEKTALKSKKMTITYNQGGGKIVDFDQAGMKLSIHQEAAPAMTKILHELGLGTNFEFFSSYVNEDGVRVFLNDAGAEQKAYSGVYRKKDGTIRIDLNAYNGRGLTLNAMAHELTHFIEQWSPEKYKILADFLVNTYEKTDMTMHERVLKEQARLERIRQEKVSYDEAYNEVVANAMSKMFDDGKLVERLTELKAKDKTLAEKLWEGIKKIFAKFLAVYEKESALFKDAADLVEMKETFEQLHSIFAEALVDASENFQASEQIGLEIDTETESASPAIMHSEHTWTESDYVQQRDMAAKEIAKAIGVSEKKAKDYIDSVNSIAKMIAEDRSRLDYFSSPGRSSFVDNSEYGGSFDFSTLCKKRRLLTGTFTAIQKALPNTALTAHEILDIRDRMKKANLEVSCGLCYVEGSRANMGQFAKEFLRLYKQYYPDAWQPNMADVNTPDGIEWVRINHPECYEQYEYFWNHYGTLKPGDKNLFASQQKPKLYQLHTEYKGEILDKFKDDDKVEDKNLNGGIRLQSFSDFEIVHLIDTMQIIMDMSRVGLAGQAYTKVPDFAWALGETGLKINLSLIAKGVDANGKLIFDDVEGMPIADAMKLRDRYSKNVGTILVAFNDEQLLAAMADDRVDFIIPFHRSQWKKSQYEAMGLPAKTKDYTFMQNEKFIKPQFHEYRGRMVKDKATNYMPNEYWDFSKSGKENAEAYLEMCARNNKRPKFYKLLQNNGDGSYSLKADGSTDGYWKLLIDFKMYDNEGNGSPQMPVKPEFNMDEATRMLNDYSGGHSNFPVAQGIVDAFVKDYKAIHKGDMYSSQETDADSEGFKDYDIVSAVYTIRNEKAKRGHDLVKVGTMPTLYQNLFGLSGDVYVSNEHLYQNMVSRATAEAEGRFNKDNSADYHELGEGKIINAIEQFQDPLVIMESLKDYDEPRLVAILDENGNDGQNLMAVMELYAPVAYPGKAQRRNHVLITIYEKNSLPDYIEKTIDKGRILHIKEGLHQTRQAGLQLAGAVSKETLKKNVARFNKKVKAFKEKNNIQYSEHETDYSNRSLLANAFEGITKSSIEYKLIQRYKGHIAELNKLEAKLSELNAEIRKIRFGTTGTRDTARLAQLEAEAKNAAKAINRQDKKLLSLEASEPLRKVIERERKKEAQKTKDHVKEIQQNKKVRAEQTELRHKIRKAVRDLDKLLNRGNKKINVKEDMRGFVSKALDLADYLFTDHISNDELIRRGITVRMNPKEAALVKETEDILAKLYDEADSLTDEEFTRLDAKRKANEDKLRNLLIAQRNERLSTPVYQLFDDLVTEYASLKNSKQDAVKAAYSEDVERLLRTFTGDADSDRAKALKNMRVADMTTEELWKLYNAYTIVKTTVRDANKFHVKGMTETIEQVVGRIAGDFGSRKIPDKDLAIAAQKFVNKLGWDYEKLYYALDRIGSEAFTELIMNIADSENIVMQDIIESAVFRDEMVEKYGFNNWNVNKEIDREFLDNTGKKFKLTLGQLMSLYAYSRREGAWDHIEYGGFVFGEAALTNPRPADSYKLSKEQCEAITSLLTKEQKGYVEDMQKFLSETMGTKGNEVSMMLYGIKMFGEKNYFPIHIAGQFKAQAQESQAKAAAGFGSMSNAGFTHAQNPSAKAPFVLEGFNEVWSDHVNEMSRYHGTVPALEDLRRVMNRSTYSDAVSESQSIKQLMENSYGKEAVDYFDNLYREANSGAITDKLQNKSKKRLSLFRKNAVAYSLSVLIQQPASLVRAYALIDRKYFGYKGFGTITSGIAKAVSDKWTKTHTDAYNEMLKYAPGVTMAKEIGGFDTATGGSIRSYLLDTKKSLKQKWNTGTTMEKSKAVLELVDDNVIANLPNVADKIAWIEIWNACKRETVATHKELAPTSEEFMKAVGERFTEVIRATQVYDSIFAKSPMLKSKNLAVQYLVSFMNEPNTVANMVEKAVRDATRGNWKQGARTAAVVIHSIVFTNVLKSLIYAMRDDDEDETYIEKYIESIVGGMMNDLNALNYIPLARDAWSVAHGYDVERADMAIIADAVDALGTVFKNAAKDTEDMTEEELAEFDKKVTEANWRLVESVASFFGIPIKNIRREITAMINHARIASANAGMTTASSAWDTISEAVNDSIPFMSSKKSKTDKLYDAIVSGDKSYLGRLKSTYKTDSSYQSAVRKGLRDNDSRIHEAAQARVDGNIEEYKRIFKEIKKEGKFTFDDIMSAINSEEAVIQRGESSGKVSSEYSANSFVEAMALGNTREAQAMKDDIISAYVANGKTQTEAEKQFASNVSSSTHEAYSSGLLDETGAKNMLVEHAGKDEEEAASKVSYWAFCRNHAEYDDLSESKVTVYYEYCEDVGIDLETYYAYIQRIAECKGDTRKMQILKIIGSMNVSGKQKTALLKAAGYSN